MHAQCQSFNDKKLKIETNISQILLSFVTYKQIRQDIAFAQNTRQKKNSQLLSLEQFQPKCATIYV